MEWATSEQAPWVSEQFRALESSSSPRVEEIRKVAYEKFLENGIPTTGQEDWRYTNLSRVARTNYTISGAVSVPAGLSEFLRTRGLPESTLAGKLVLINGRFVPELSLLPRGVSVSALSRDGSSDLIDSLFERDRLFETESLVALNAALAVDVLCLSASTRVERPIEILSLAVANAHPTSCFPRILVKVEKGGSLTVVEKQLSTGGETFSSVVTEIDIAENASLTHVQIQELGAEATQVATLKGRIARDGKLFSHVFHLGGAIVRNEIRPVFVGVNAEAYLNGLTAVTAKQHIDNFTVIDHAEPHCFSREQYKGIYGDQAEGVFCGTIIVRQKAQKTNAIQSNQSLLLSPNATVETKPQLKIWADDVKCTHGATVGQLDDNALFYLRARGIPELEAKRMLTEAFLGELLDSVPDEHLQRHVRELFAARLSAMLG